MLGFGTIHLLYPHLPRFTTADETLLVSAGNILACLVLFGLYLSLSAGNILACLVLSFTLGWSHILEHANVSLRFCACDILLTTAWA